jgi:hypothetical protein
MKMSGMNQLDRVDNRIAEAVKLVSHVAKIEAIAARTRVRLKDGDSLPRLNKLLRLLKTDRDEALESFERRREEDLRRLEQDAAGLSSHHPCA